MRIPIRHNEHDCINSPNKLMNSRQNCKLKVQIDTIRQLITICTQSHRPQTGEQSLPASIHIERRQLFILYVKLNFHETRLNFSQSAQAGLVETNLYVLSFYI